MKKIRNSRANKLENVSPRFLHDHELHDTPARLFRAILRDMKMDEHKWTKFLRDYLEWVIPDDPDNASRVRTDRTTRSGNIKDTYFQKPGMTFNKLLEGLSILRMDTCKVTIEATDQDGNVYVVSDIQKVTGAARPNPDAPKDKPS